MCLYVPSTYTSTSFFCACRQTWALGISELELLALFPQRVRGFLMSSYMCVEVLCTLYRSVQIFISITIPCPHFPLVQGHVALELNSWTLGQTS